MKRSLIFLSLIFVVGTASSQWLRTEIDGRSLCERYPGGERFTPRYESKSFVTVSCNVLNEVEEWQGRLGVSSIVDGRAAVAFAWQPFTRNTDGSPLTDLAGYVIDYGPVSCAQRSRPAAVNCYQNREVIDNAKADSHLLVVSVDRPTTLYFALAGRTASGKFSAYSNEVSRRFEVVQ